MSTLRPYQHKLSADIFNAWRDGHQDVMAVSPTGSGKTVTMGHVIRSLGQPALAVAHRQELVGQISMALALEGIPHRLIAPISVQRDIQREQVEDLGRHWIDPGARAGVAGVDTLVKREMSQDSFYREIALKVGDEGHHWQAENKWGRAWESLPQARGLLFTATPRRADGGALRKGAGGCADVMVEGPTPGDLIDMGYLTDYDVVGVESDVDYSQVNISKATGDLNQGQLRAVVHASARMVGDVVEAYLQHARGKLGVCFAVDVEEAQKIARGFREAGVRAEVVSAKTDTGLRRNILKRFARRELDILVNVDLFGEGFDLPAIEVVILARRTESLALHLQQMGRALRLMIPKEWQKIWDTLSDLERRTMIAQSAKPKALIIDHVMNVHRLLLPDTPRIWTLNGRDRSNSAPSDAIPVRTCANADYPTGSGLACRKVYLRIEHACPKCGMVPVPASRDTPAAVDGDLTLYSPELLAALRGERARIDAAPKYWPGISHAQKAGLDRNHQERIIAQAALRDAIALWSGWQIKQGMRDERAQYKLFTYQFGVDMMTAQTLIKADAEALTNKIAERLLRDRVERMK